MITRVWRHRSSIFSPKQFAELLRLSSAYPPRCVVPRPTKRGRCRTLTSATTTSPPPPPPKRGLFSIPELTSPNQFAVLAQEAMVRGDALRTAIAADAATTPPTIAEARRRLYRLDSLSRIVCNVIDAAELCRHVHADAAWRQAADDTFTTLSHYISAQLNGDVRLYRATLAVLQAPTEVTNQFTEEERRLVQSLKDEFERDGVHWIADDDDAIRDHQSQIVALESQFQQNLVHWQRDFGASKEDVAAVLPPAVWPTVGIRVLEQDPSMVQLSADGQLLQTLTKYSTSPSLRKQVFMEYATAVPENKQVLAELRYHRHALAQRLGYASHGERYLQDKMVSSPQRVEDFLNQVVQSTQTAFATDMERLSHAKAQLEGNPKLEAWDMSHYTGLCKSQSGRFDTSQLSQYLTLEQTMESIKILCQRLFGVSVQEVPTTADERWDGHSSNSAGGSIRRLDFARQESGEPLGILYLDLHPRPGKYGHAAHFTVRCGCVTNGEEVVEQDAEHRWEYQLPVVALVCNLSSDRGVLTHGEVETVFHELGHALHSLLSRTQFQHLSGTRAAMDFVETPSQLFENFVWDTDFLRILGRDPVTGSTIPDSMIQALQRSRFEFTSIERRTQIIYSKFDQRMFSHPGGTTEDAYDVFSSLHQDLGMPFAAGTHWYSRFGHLVTYASGYYGYLFSSVFAHDIWQRHLEGRSLCSSQGRIIWNKMLLHGGARDPNAILADLKEAS